MTFSQIFGENSSPLQDYFAPGRVNLIGEHIDYNGGWVLPMAIEQGIKATVRRRTDQKIRIHSLQQEGIFEIDLAAPDFQHRPSHWMNYPLGIIHMLAKVRQIPLDQGMEILLDSNLPVGSGLSSSAALEVLIAYIYLHLANHPLQSDKLAIAQLCQQVENDFVGVKCGIMDQAAVALGKKGEAIYLQCDSLEYQYVPANVSPYVFLILNSNKQRQLADSKYNERKGECEAALAVIQQEREIANLCEAKVEDLDLLKDPILYNRARHVVGENQRVQMAVESLQHRDWHTFGRLMNASHFSLQLDYEVTGKELDTLVQAAHTSPFCLGARMTGAGFGGCAVALVVKNRVKDFVDLVKKVYIRNTGLTMEAYVSMASQGVSIR